MSFLHPERLALLLGVVALAALYAAVWRRRSQAVARYTQPHLHDRLAPERSKGIRRHVAPAMALGVTDAAWSWDRVLSRRLFVQREPVSDLARRLYEKRFTSELPELQLRYAG